MPRPARSTTPVDWSRMRMTTDSPWTLGSVTTRRSTWWPSMFSPTRPSCGTRRSAMSRSLMIFTRLMTPETMGRGQVREPWSTASTRHGRRVLEHAVDGEAGAQGAAVGRQVHVGGPLLDGLGDDAVDELDDR